MTDVSSIASLGAAFAAGLLSVLSPCVLPLMPAYLSLISGLSVEEIQDGNSIDSVRRRVIAGCIGFVLGFSTIFVALGASATVLGQVLRRFQVEVLGHSFGIAQLAGVVIVVMGLHIAGLTPIRALYRERRVHLKPRRMSFVGTYLVGAAFAFGWTPCVGPILGGILTIAGSRDTVAQGIGLLSVYSAGLAVPFLLAGWSIEFFFGAFSRLKHHFRVLELVSGGLLVGVGLLVMTDQLSRLNNYFGFMTNVVSAAERILE
ncbi:MAG TPA: cytochrome c biogenesis protein CcdA [Myxococcota bacterium]|jgi:cytochrome c-type biogenesis protein|nr:cytochrome c biogenesis protein CcdA [Myxococcota bacterium]